ncbi:MAG: OmpA family protein [Gallionellaceae bacterium]|nr:OmpA family protein [Gallionellaceae bacterium]
MRTTPLLFGILATALFTAGIVTAQAAGGHYYDPSNAASPTGKTIGYKLHRTIGCPGRDLLGTPCLAPAPAAAMPAPVAAMPAPVAVAPVAAPVVVFVPVQETMSVAATPVAAPKKLVLVGVNFEFDKSTLRQEDISILDKDAASFIKGRGNAPVEVAGHTDNRGSDEYNMILSRQRAEAVRDYLIAQGVSGDRLTAKGYGEHQPIAANITDEGRLSNRRVELVPLN